MCEKKKCDMVCVMVMMSCHGRTREEENTCARWSSFYRHAEKNPRLLLLPHTPQTGKHVMLAVHRFLHSLSPMEYTDGMEAIRFAGLCTERCPFHD